MFTERSRLRITGHSQPQTTRMIRQLAGLGYRRQLLLSAACAILTDSCWRRAY